MAERAVLFVNVGWAKKYDGTETIVGNHRYLAKHGDDCSEGSAFKRRYGVFRCGIGAGRVEPRRFDVVVVARQPDRPVHRIVGIYRDAEYTDQFPHQPGSWGIAIARRARLLPVGARPAIEWPGAMGMRRWAAKHPGLQEAYQRLLDGDTTGDQGRHARPRVFVYRWGTNPDLWSAPTDAERSLALLKRACAELDDDVAWEIGSGTRMPAGSRQLRVDDVVIFYAGTRFGKAAGIYGIARAGSVDDTSGDLAVRGERWELPVRWLPCSREMAMHPIADFARALAPPGPASTLYRIKNVPRALQALIDGALRGRATAPRGNTTPDDARRLSGLFRDTPLGERERVFAEIQRLVRDARLRPIVLTVWPAACAACSCALSTTEGQCEVEVAHVKEVRDGGPDELGNAMPLCRTHHWAFDRGLWAVEPSSLRIVVLRSVRRQPRLREIHGKVIRRPDAGDRLYPEHPFLEQRWKQFQRRSLHG